MERPEKLAGALGRALQGLNMDLRVREAKAMALWPDIVGEVTATKTKPLHVNRGTMVVGVASSAWANQLNLLKPQLLDSLEARVGAGVIRDLRWKTGPWDDGEAGSGPAPTFARRRLPDAPPLPESQKQAMADMVAPIDDQKLKSAVERALLAQAERRQRLAAAGWKPCDRCGVLFDPAPAAPPPLPLCPMCLLEANPG